MYVALILLLTSSFRLRHMQGLKESQLTADVELLPTTEAAVSKTSKQAARPPISMSFEVSLITYTV